MKYKSKNRKKQVCIQKITWSERLENYEGAAAARERERERERERQRERERERHRERERERDRQTETETERETDKSIDRQRASVFNKIVAEYRHSISSNLWKMTWNTALGRQEIIVSLGEWGVRISHLLATCDTLRILLDFFCHRSLLPTISNEGFLLLIWEFIPNRSSRPINTTLTGATSPIQRELSGNGSGKVNQHFLKLQNSSLRTVNSLASYTEHTFRGWVESSLE